MANAEVTVRTDDLDGVVDTIRDKIIIPREEEPVVEEAPISDPDRATLNETDPARAQAGIMTEDEVDAAFGTMSEEAVDAAFEREDEFPVEEDVLELFGPRTGDFGGIEVPKQGRLQDDFDLYPPQLPDFRLNKRTPDDEAAIDAVFAADSKRFEEGTLVSKQTEDQAITAHYKALKALENPREKGMVRGKEGEKFMPFESDEGRGPDKSMSIFEIGYGIKIPEKWLSDDKRQWPLVDNVRINIKEGVTRDQADSMLRSHQEGAYKAAKKRLDKWDGMTEGEKSFWGDLTYNGGSAVVDKNPKAKALANKGFTVEAMVTALDYIKSAGKISRGLLNRRISKYNDAAVEVNGTPLIEEYRFQDDKVEVKFAHEFVTDKVTPKFKKLINSSPDKWMTLIDKTKKALSPSKKERTERILSTVQKHREAIKEAEDSFINDRMDKLSTGLLDEYKTWSPEERKKYGVDEIYPAGTFDEVDAARDNPITKKMDANHQFTG